MPKQKRSKIRLEDIKIALDEINERLKKLEKPVFVEKDIFTRRVRVDRWKTNQQMLDATGRKQYTNAEVVDSMPRSGIDEGEIVFFKSDRNLTDAELEKEYELRGLKPATPDFLAQANTDDPAFADDHPNATHWKDKDGKWCFATFDRWGGERHVEVYRDDRNSDWGEIWSFAGIRK